MTTEQKTPMAIRRAGIDDAARLAEIAERTFRETFAADNSPADMDAHCVRSYSADIQRRELENRAIDTLVCVGERGEFVGYAQLRAGAPESAALVRPIELWRFYLDRARHGSGLAHLLMGEVVTAARSRGAATLWLGVWERNPRAQAFYRKHGFEPIGAHSFVVGTDVQTDILMARPL